ncbi:MAG TPA: methyltransferase domain-containing protein [Vicinamibacteria bacterium]|nr:methyltransferase domain-containing protein [Vicinamibacteria bacterium]
MRAHEAAGYRHPRTGAALVLAAEETRDGHVVSGALAGDGDRFPIVAGIPRFCAGGEAASFGYQWTRFQSTQLDSRGGWGGQSRDRLRAHTRWPERMEGRRVLEAGCGMGRFTEVLAATGAEVWSFDATAAVEANAANNARQANVRFAQADIFAPPFAPASFDHVLCVGVLQHTPDPARAFAALARLLAPGGEIAVDVYRRGWRCLLTPKYALRPLTRRLAPQRLHRLVRAHVGWVHPLTGALHRVLGARARHLSWMLGVADYRGVYPMDAATARELAELDTFDMLAPAHDHPQTARAVSRWMEEAGLVEAAVEPVGGLIRARGRRP